MQKPRANRVWGVGMRPEHVRVTNLTKYVTLHIEHRSKIMKSFARGLTWTIVAGRTGRAAPLCRSGTQILILRGFGFGRSAPADGARGPDVALSAPQRNIPGWIKTVYGEPS